MSETPAPKTSRTSFAVDARESGEAAVPPSRLDRGAIFNHLPRLAMASVVWIFAAILLIFLALPLVGLVVRALRDGGGFSELTRHTLRQALTLSLVTSFISLGVILVIGTPLAYLLARHRFPGDSLINTLIDLPMVLPPAVAGLALLMAFGRRGLLGGVLADLGIDLAFATPAVIVAQIFVAVPFYVRSAKASFSRIDRDIERAAASLGANPLRTFFAVTLPLARAGLAAGAVIAWARAVGEFGATIMFAGNFPGRTQTMPLAIYGTFDAGDLGTALMLAVILLATSLFVLLGVRLISRDASDTLSWRMRPLRSTDRDSKA